MNGGRGGDVEGFTIKFGLECWAGVLLSPGKVHEVALVRVDKHTYFCKDVNCLV